MAKKLKAVTKMDDVMREATRADLQEVRKQMAAAVPTRRCISFICGIRGGKMKRTNLEIQTQGLAVWYCVRCGKMRMLHD